MTELPGPWEIGCYAANEFALIGEAIGGGFVNTNELLLKYKEAINGPDKAKWKKAMGKEHDQMVKMGVWKAIPLEKLVPNGTKPITSTWASKKKSNGTYLARVNARGFEQIPGVHYDPKTIGCQIAVQVPVRCGETAPHDALVETRNSQCSSRPVQVHDRRNIVPYEGTTQSHALLS
jgi:hypothetical protein